jgi:DNA-binding transcriptional LysR family regulator
MELRHLEQILEICRAGGFSGAARKLQISQPTLSKSIARLEAQLSLKLFERNGGEGRVRIAVGPASRLKPLPELMRRVAVRFPKLHVETIQETGPGVMTALHEGRVDMAFGYSEHAARYGELIRKKMFEDAIVLVARPGHPALDLPAPAGPRELLRYPFALPNVLPGVERWAGETSREEAENLRAFVSDDYALILQRALDTDTIAMGASFLFEDELKAGRLAVIASTLDVPYACWMLTTAERWRSPLIKAMAELSKAAVSQPPASAAA